MTIGQLTATCPVCGRENRRVRRDGTLWHHNDPSRPSHGSRFGALCEGVGKTVENAERWARGSYGVEQWDSR